MIVRLTCADMRHGKLIERAIDNTETDKDTPLEEVNKAIAERLAKEIIEAHRATYGAGCHDNIMVEIIDNEVSVLVLWLKRRVGQRDLRDKEFMGVFHDSDAVEQYIENYLTMAHSQAADRVLGEDFTAERQVVTRYLHSTVDDIVREAVAESEPEVVEAEPAGVGG